MAEDKRAKLEGELESAERTLRDALDFINDDRHLTPEGIAKREVLRKDVEAIERDLEAIRQEHGLGYPYGEPRSVSLWRRNG